MGHKYPGKITKRFVSILAASAMITSQIPANLSAFAVYADNGQKTLNGSISASNVINIAPEKIMDTATVSTTSTIVTKATVTTTSAATSTTKTDVSNTATASVTSAATTTKTAVSTTATSTIATSGKIQPNPTLSCDKVVISASEAGKSVPVSIYINDDNFKNEAYYRSASVCVDFDGRLNLTKIEAGITDGSLGMSMNNSSNLSQSRFRKTQIITMNSNSAIGKNGTFATINVTIPAYAKPGDIYYFNIYTNNSNSHFFNYSNSKIKTNCDQRACKTASTDDDKYLKDTTFDGYILIDPQSEPNASSAARSYDVVMKDLVFYNVYNDHAEVAYCDYEAEKAEIASEINGQKVTAIADYAFENSKVKSVVIPDTVTTIGYGAFYKSSISAIELPENVNTLGSSAFSNCESLKSVKLSKELDSIQSNLFYSCPLLETVTIPESIKKIGDYAFYNCKALKELSLPSQITFIPSYMCYGCTSLSKVNIPDAVTGIGSYAFNNAALESIEIPDMVTSVYDGAFGNNPKLSYVKLSSGMTMLNNSLFSGCTALESIEIPETISLINNNVFSNSGLKKISLPKNLAKIGNAAFQGTKLETLEYPATTVTCGTNVFAKCTKLTSITFPDDLKSIPVGTFNGCTALEKIELPDTVTSIGVNAFYDSGIKDINIPKSMTTLSESALAGTQIESIKLPDNISYLGNSVFMNCTKLTSVDLGNKITSIPNYTFSGCTELKKVDFPSSVSTINSNIFSNSGVTEVQMTNRVTTIYADTFADSNVESIIYPDNLVKLPNNAYGGASKLKDPKLPSSLKTLPSNIFTGCTSITSFEIPTGITTIDSYAFTKSSIKELKIPDTVVSIKDYAFSNSCLESIELNDKFTVLPNALFSNSQKLKSVKLPANITYIPTSTFLNCNALESIDIPESVTSIGNSAFKGCASLSEIKLPSEVTSIGSDVFGSCTKITALELPAKLETIGSNAFSGTGIKELNIPASVKTTQYAFSGSYIETITYPDSLTELPEYAYSGATKMTSVKLPSKLAAIPASCFYGCSSLIEFTIPSTVKSIGENAFKQSGVKSLKVPATVESMSNYAFTDTNLEKIEFDEDITELPKYLLTNSKKLTSVKLPSKLKVIPANTFNGCSALESITLPASLETISESAFAATGIKTIDIPETVIEIKSSAFMGATKLTSIKLPSKLTVINDSLFYNCSSLSSVTIQEGVESIGSYAFYNCTSLTALKLPSTVKNLDTQVFGYCNKLSILELSENLESIGSSAFANTAIKSINIPDSVKKLNSSFADSSIETITYSDSLTELPGQAYSGAAKMTSVKLPSKLTAVPDSAFNGCKSLTSIEIPDTVTSIGMYAFQNSGIKELKLPSKLEIIGASAFSGCSSLSSIELPDSVTTIDSYAFSNSGISSIKLPGTLKTIGSFAFQNATAITELTIPSSVETIGRAAFYGTSLNTITIPDTVKSLDSYNLFNGCTKLESVILPSSLTVIDTSCFNNCTSLKSVELPEMVNTIKNNAFYNCSSLTSVYIPANVTTIQQNAFKNSKINTIIGYKDTYAEKYAADNKLTFKEAETKIWDKKDSLPSAGVYKLDCDVTLTETASANMCVLDIDLNGHKLIVDSIPVGGTMTVRDSSKDKTGSIISSGEKSLFIVTGILKLLGGTITANGIKSNTGTINVASNGNFILDGATVKANKGYGIYSTADNSKVHIVSGTVTSTENYGIYVQSKSYTDICGKLDINGAPADIYLGVSGILTITAPITGGKVSIERSKAGNITSGYASFHKDTEPSTFFSAKNDSTLSLNDSGEVVYRVPVTTTTVTTKITTTSTTTSKPLTSSTTTGKATTSTTGKTTTTSLTSTPISTITTNNINHPKLNVSGELTFKPMTKEEIITAGIDLSDESNYNCVKYTIEAQFGVESAAINRIVDRDDESSDYVFFEVDGHEPVLLEDGDFTWVEGLGAHVMHTETVDEEMYLIIYGQCKWLKEFYDVQLMIVNKGDGTLKNCTSSLDVPEGLTLAKGDAVQDMGELAPNEVKTTNWYLRGDKEGDYSLTASFKGKNEGEPFELKFKSKDNLHVYSSKALHMTVEMPMYSYYKKEYPINIILKNVSDKPIYDLENKILGVKQGSKVTITYRDYDDEGNLISEKTETKEKVIYEREGGPCVQVEELKPGQSVTLEVKVMDLWKSVYEQYLAAEKFDEVTSKILSMVKNDPNALDVDIIRSVYSSALNEMPVEHVLRNVKVGFIDSEPIPYNVVVTPAKSSENVPASRIMTNTANTLIGDVFNRAYSDTAPELTGFAAFRDNFICNVDISNTDEINAAFNDYLSKYDNDIWKMTEDMNLVIHPHDGKPANISIVPDTRRSAPSETGSNNSATANAFAIDEINGVKTDENGILKVTDDTIIKISADKIGASGTLVIDYTDGTVEEHKIRSVEVHECKPTGKYVMAAAPKNGQDGLAVETCEVCGEIIDSVFIPKDAVAMLSNKTTYTDLKEAVEAAGKLDKTTELTIFGKATIISELNIPDNVDVIIAQGADITVQNGGKLLAKGNVNDFSGYNYNLSGNGPLVTTNTTTNATTATTSTTLTVSATSTTSVTTIVSTVTTQPDDYKLGDVNNDGKVNAVDASTVLTYYANISTNKDGGFTDAQKKAADLDNNGDINAVDASYILSYYAYTSTTKEAIMPVEEYMKKK